ncbi:MAG: MFS transporter [Chitinophagaceae bacterium]
MRQQGLKNNWKQFWLLVFINAFVGSMVGLERSVLSGFGEKIFSINGKTALLSFIIAFGTSKALANLLMGKLTQYITRKQVLIIGWIAALPVPFLLMYASSWNWIIVANILLGINQGLAWSSTVIMKIDLVGERNRGLAMGINEFAGYLAVGVAAYLSASIAAAKGFAFYPFVPGILFSVAGFLLTVFFIKDTAAFVHHEAKNSTLPLFKNIWKASSYQHPNMGSVTINGLVNNLNDGLVWGLLPILLIQKNYSLQQIGLIAGMYPIVWGMGQLFTGKLGDVFCKKQLITGGMLLQAVALFIITIASSLWINVAAMILLGIGTAFVYPNFLTVIAENTHPHQRAQSMSIFRFWRDSGYVIGAVLSGIIADQFGINVAFIAVASLTAGAALLAELRMCCTKKLIWKSQVC